MQLTANFSRHEFTRSDTATRCHIDNTIPFALMGNVTKVALWLQTLRDRLCKHYGREICIIISSGYRCPALNKELHGSISSAHMNGLAADITATTLTPYELAIFIKKYMTDCPVDQCILEHDQWVHIGLDDDGFMRAEFLESFRGKDLFGKPKTRYKPLILRRRKSTSVC